MAVELFFPNLSCHTRTEVDMITKQKLQHHIKHLEQLHETIDKQIEAEFKLYGSQAVVTRMKKEKLRLKDEIEKTKVKLNDTTE